MPREVFDMLLLERIDALLCTNLTANHYLRKDKFRGKITHAQNSYYQKDYHIGFSKFSEAKALIPEVNEVIRQMKEDGSLAEIISEYVTD